MMTPITVGHKMNTNTNTNNTGTTAANASTTTSSISTPQNNPDIVDFKGEILNELHNNSFDSLKIWKMFQSKKSSLPNNQRIQNLSWRVNSISNSKRQQHSMRVNKPQHQQPYSKLNSFNIQQRNLSLFQNAPSINNDHNNNSNNHPTNEEFDYIEHIKKMTKEEFGDYNNSQILDNVTIPTEYRASNPISISAKDHNSLTNSSSVDYSPEDIANSLTSNSNSIFSNTRYDHHSLSISSQVSANQQPPAATSAPVAQSQSQPQQQPQQQQSQPQQKRKQSSAALQRLSQQQQKQSQQQSHPQQQQQQISTTANDFNIENFLDLETKSHPNDSNFNEFDLLDMTKFDSSIYSLHDDKSKEHDNTNTNTNFSLSNYINSLETAVKDSEPSSNMMTTPIFNNNQVTTVNENFSIANNTNYNYNVRYNHGTSNNTTGTGTGTGTGGHNSTSTTTTTKEQMSCYSCGTTTTPLWRKSINEKNENLILCNACGLFLKLHGNLSKKTEATNQTTMAQAHQTHTQRSSVAVPSSSSSSSVRNKDDQMGEIFSIPAAPSSKTSHPNHHQIPQQQHQQQYMSTHAPQQQRRTNNPTNLKEEDYEWLKFGL